MFFSPFLLGSVVLNLLLLLAALLNSETDSQPGVSVGAPRLPWPWPGLAWPALAALAALPWPGWQPGLRCRDALLFGRQKAREKIVNI